MLEEPTNYYSIDDGTLILKAKRSPLVVLFFLYLLTLLIGLAPVLGIIYSLAEGNGLKFAHFISIVVEGIICFGLLRICLWNSFGSESITIKKNSLQYYANYGWFKDSLKNYALDSISFEIHNVGYEDEDKAVLIIRAGGNTIQTVCRQPVSDLVQVIKELQKLCDAATRNTRLN